MAVSLRKTRFIQPHVLFTGVYLLKRLFVGFLVSRRASPFGAAPVFRFFASIASPPWRSAFSQCAPVVNLGFPVLAYGSNCAVKPTRILRAAYFRALARLCEFGFYLPVLRFQFPAFCGFSHLWVFSKIGCYRLSAVYCLLCF